MKMKNNCQELSMKFLCRMYAKIQLSDSGLTNNTNVFVISEKHDCNEIYQTTNFGGLVQ